MGPVISQDQQQRVLGFLERASSATVLTGGATLGERGWFVQPTVVTDVSQDDEIVQDEVFGPVVTVQRFADDAQAIEWANGVRYGLAASVWTRDVGARAERGAEAPVRHGVDQRPPRPDHLRDAPRRLQGLGLRQGHVGVLDGGVHADQARGGEAQLANSRDSDREQLGELAGRRLPFTCGCVRARLLGLGRARDHGGDRRDGSEARRLRPRATTPRAPRPTS